MTPPEQEHPNNWGYLIGRLEGQEAQLQDLKAQMQRVNDRLDTGLQEVNTRLDNGMQEVRDEQRETNRRVDRVYHAVITIGGGILVALVGVIISLIILIIRS